MNIALWMGEATAHPDTSEYESGRRNIFCQFMRNLVKWASMVLGASCSYAKENRKEENGQ
jgi:hypothetical protein